MQRVISKRSRAAGALWSIFIADSLSMPVHWFYNPADISSAFGYIKDYQPAPPHHPSSIMNLHSTSTGGRGQQSGNIVGDVILKGKKDFWGQPRMHYHQGMKAGENTLNALCARVLLRNLTNEKANYDENSFLADYVKFMTTEGTHNDTYAESYHRAFFANYAKKVPLLQCAGVTHDTPSVGAFVSLPMIVISSLNNKQEMQTRIKKHLFLTHPDNDLLKFAILYSNALFDIINGSDPETVLQSVAKSIQIPLNELLQQPDDAIVRKFGSACYITSSFPIVIFLCYKYRGKYIEGLLQNTNLGGENCHRGSALGGLLGSICGKEGIPEKYITGLKDSQEIEKEIENFLNTCGLTE